MYYVCIFCIICVIIMNIYYEINIHNVCDIQMTNEGNIIAMIGLFSCDKRKVKIEVFVFGKNNNYFLLQHTSKKCKLIKTTNCHIKLLGNETCFIILWLIKDKAIKLNWLSQS